MTQKLTQKSQGPKQVDAKVEKTESKENIFSGLATFAPTLQVFWGSCNNWGQKTSVHSLHFCYPSTFVSTCQMSAFDVVDIPHFSFSDRDY